MTRPPPPGRPAPIRDRYNRAEHFPRVTVIGHRHSTRHGGIYAWSVLGPGLPWLGQLFASHANAITFAQQHATKLANRSPR